MPRFCCCLPAALAICSLFLVACAPLPPAEDADSASTNPNARDSSGQSYAEAVATVCDVDRLSGADPNDPLRQASQRDEYLVEHVKNADGIYFLTVSRTQASAEQAKGLTSEAKRSQITHCPLADALRAEGSAPSAGQ